MRTKVATRRLPLILVFVAALLVVLALSAGIAQAAPDGGAVYTETNGTTNQVLVYDREANGMLSPVGAYNTGGTGASLAHPPQGAVALSQDGRWLFAANAGSNDITVFAVEPWGLVRVDKEPSGGTTPVSLTVHDHLLYVLNAGGSGNIAGFYIGPFGKLYAVPGSIKPLSGLTTYPQEISFNLEGNLLVVTELDTKLIDTYKVNFWGMANAPVFHTASGPTPYGFAFTERGTLLVSEAGGALSSYDVSPREFDLISGSISNGPVGSPCWVAITENGKYAYTGNGGGGTISSYQVSSKGKLTLLSGTATVTGGAILDLAFSNNSHFLYALDRGNGAIDIFRANPDGSLTAIGTTGGVPGSATGLAAR